MKKLACFFMDIILAALAGSMIGAVVLKIAPNTNAVAGFFIGFGVCLIAFWIMFFVLGKMKKSYRAIASLSGTFVFFVLTIACFSIFNPFLSGSDPALFFFGSSVAANVFILLGAFVVFEAALLIRIRLSTKKEEPKVAQTQPVPTVVTSRDTDKQVSAAAQEKRHKPAERFVRDPWGNLIPESEYNRHAEEIKNRKL